MHIDPNAKFAAFCLSRCGVKEDLPTEVEIESNVWVSRRFDVEIAKHWREWLGSLTADEMEEDGLVVYVTAPSREPRMLDEENEALKLQANDMLDALLLQGVPAFMKGFFVTGANIDGETRIRQHSSVRELFCTWELPDFLVGIDEIRRSSALAHHLRFIQDAPKPEWGRLVRAVNTLLTANRERNSYGQRLHQFVRSLEGLIKLPKREGRQSFADRGQTFTSASNEARSILVELYALRSAVEHLNVAMDVVPGQTEAERIDIVNHRTRQADSLARFAILRILESHVMFNNFRNDAQIDAFWRLEDHVRVSLWGDRLDIVAIA